MTTLSIDLTATAKPLRTPDMAYWPLWVNVALPLLGTLLFVVVQAVLLYIDDPGLRRAKRAKLVSGDAEKGTVEFENDAKAGADKGQPSASATTATTAVATTDAGVQCELIKPVESAQHQSHHAAAASFRRRTSSAGSVPESDTMRLLEGMLLRPRRPLSRRRLSESEQQQQHGERRASESAGAAGGLVGPTAAAAAGSSTGAGVSVTQSLTGPGAKRFAASIQQRLLAVKRGSDHL